MQREMFRKRLNSRSSSFGSHVRIPPETDLRPLHWSKFFDRSQDVQIPGTSKVFRVYSNKLDECFAHSFQGPAVVLLHGAGYSGLSWAPFAQHLTTICECTTIAIDLRGHGCSQTEEDQDLSTESLVGDVEQILEILFFGDANESMIINQDLQKSYGYTPTTGETRIPPLILVGHSMGGALAVHLSHSLMAKKQFDVKAVVVIDVVEGTAMAALNCMHTVLMSRPSWFRTIGDAIRWCLVSGQTKNFESARVSFPGQIKSAVTMITASEQVPQDVDMIEPEVDPIVQTTESSSTLSIAEEDENAIESDFVAPKSSPSSSLNQSTTIQSGFVWRIDLTKTAPFWKGWFDRLSELFLSAPVQNRLLILAGMDRLDKDLTIGQMQGKFQLQVLPQVGHAVQEDNPVKVAEVIAQFLVKNQLTISKQSFEHTFPCC